MNFVIEVVKFKVMKEIVFDYNVEWNLVFGLVVLVIMLVGLIEDF